MKRRKKSFLCFPFLHVFNHPHAVRSINVEIFCCVLIPREDWVLPHIVFHSGTSMGISDLFAWSISLFSGQYFEIFRMIKLGFASVFWKILRAAKRGPKKTEKKKLVEGAAGTQAKVNLKYEPLIFLLPGPSRFSRRPWWLHQKVLMKLIGNLVAIVSLLQIASY